MRLTATAFDLTRPLRGDAVLAVSITAKSEPDAMELIDGQKSGKLYDVTITEHREHRSTTANAYFHKLASELSKVLKTDIDSVKKHLVRLYGTPAEEDGYPITVNVAKGVDPTIFYPYCEWLSGDEYSDTYALFKQTHTLNTAEFSHLIDGTVTECKELGIETLPPDELAKLYAQADKANRDPASGQKSGI